jgi:anti-sigma B factor antagonist
MYEAFSLSTGVREGCQIIVVRGELDEAAAPELEDAIDGCGDGWPVVVDLSNIVFISSAGIHSLLRERQARIALVCPPGNVMRLFEIVRANRRVPIFPSLDAAIEGSEFPATALGNSLTATSASHRIA